MFWRYNNIKAVKLILQKIKTSRANLFLSPLSGEGPGARSARFLNQQPHTQNGFLTL